MIFARPGQGALAAKSAPAAWTAKVRLAYNGYTKLPPILGKRKEKLPLLGV